MKYLEDKRVRSFIVAGLILLTFAFLFIKYDGLMLAVNKVINVIRPVIIGCFIAFAFQKPLNFISSKYENKYDKIYQRKLQRLKKKNNGVLPSQLPKRSTLPSKLSILTLYILALLFLTVLVVIIVPQLANSIKMFSDNFDEYYRNVEDLIQKYYKNEDSTLIQWIEDLNIPDKIYGLAEYLPDVLMKTFGITASLLGTIVDLFLGIVLSVYILAERSHLKSQGQRLGKRFCKPEKYEKISKYLHLIAEKFSSFISGQLTEAFILGILCFIGMSIFGFEYAVLISTIIGLTNLIPIVGPIIGTIPCAFILLLVNPTDAVWFIVFIIILQQLESNIIYPRVVGSSMGLPALWVSVAVIIGGGLQGIFGMVVAIPLMSFIYTVLKEKTEETVTH